MYIYILYYLVCVLTPIFRCDTSFSFVRRVRFIQDRTSCDVVVFKTRIGSAQYRSERNGIYGFNHRHRTSSARQTEPFKQIHTVERFGSVSLPPKPVFNFIVSDNRTRVYIIIRIK